MITLQMLRERPSASQTGTYSFLNYSWKIYSSGTHMVLWGPTHMADSAAFPIQPSCWENFLPECGADLGDRISPSAMAPTPAS